MLARIKRADYVSRAASERGLPVRVRYDERLMRIARDRYAGLYEYLPGRTISWESMTKKHIKLLGFAMGDIHNALREIESMDGYTVADELLAVVERMQNYFAHEGVERAMKEKLGIAVEPGKLKNFSLLINYVSSMPGQQYVHMDMVRGNILFDVAEETDTWKIDDIALTGIIDFEKAAIGHPLFDLARTLSFLLVDSTKASEKVYRYFLDSGYCKRAGRSRPNAKLLQPLILFFLMHDLYKFLRHTPYESLYANHHYNRTCELLKTYGMIK